MPSPWVAVRSGIGEHLDHELDEVGYFMSPVKLLHADTGSQSPMMIIARISATHGTAIILSRVS